MSGADILLLKALYCYKNRCRADFTPNSGDLTSAVKVARSQKLLPVLYYVFKGDMSRLFEPSLFNSIRAEALLASSSQINRDNELARICEELYREKIAYAVYKGAVCRALYDHPELRVSSDEDFLINEDYADRTVALLESNGYAVLSRKAHEIKLLHPGSSMIAELHTRITDDCSAAWNRINDLFLPQIGGEYSFDFNGRRISAFAPYLSFTVLFIHLVQHFISGGVGIRPVMDIAVFYDSFKAEIDIDFTKEQLRLISAEFFFDAVMYICKKYFDIDYNVDFDDALAEELLQDILDSGAYGTSSRHRQHSGTLTKNLAQSDGRVAGSAFRAVFPEKSVMLEKYPELSENGWKLPIYYLKRLSGFASEKDGVKAYAVGKSRGRLIKKLKII